VRRVRRETRLNPRRPTRQTLLTTLQTCTGISSGRSLTETAYDLITDFGETCRQVRDIGFCRDRQRKSARRRLHIRDLDFNQVASAALFRRYAMKPMPAKPRISVARVEGSGTPGLDLRQGAWRSLQ
jgi:hypothetical protein